MWVIIPWRRLSTAPVHLLGVVPRYFTGTIYCLVLLLLLLDFCAVLWSLQKNSGLERTTPSFLLPMAHHRAQRCIFVTALNNFFILSIKYLLSTFLLTVGALASYSKYCRFISRLGDKLSWLNHLYIFFQSHWSSAWREPWAKLCLPCPSQSFTNHPVAWSCIT